jgi:hypothetical protein
MKRKNCPFPEKEDAMENLQVSDLYVPADKFPRIDDQATFYQALQALDSAQEEYLSGRAAQQILLVEDSAGKIIGKISPIDLFCALETGYRRVNVEELVKQYGVNYISHTMSEDMHLWKNPFHDLCRKASSVQIHNFVNAPKAGQSVKIDDPLAKCYHLFVMNRHDSLFVFDQGEIAGLLRFTDVYKKVSQTMRECSL